EQAFLAVGLKAQQRPIWSGDCGGGRRAIARAVYRGDIAGVLGGPAEDCLFVEGVCRVSELRGPIAAGCGDVEMRMENDVCAVSRCPAYSLRIAKALVANSDAKFQ